MTAPEEKTAHERSNKQMRRGGYASAATLVLGVGGLFVPILFVPALITGGYTAYAIGDSVALKAEHQRQNPDAKVGGFRGSLARGLNWLGRKFGLVKEPQETPEPDTPEQNHAQSLEQQQLEAEQAQHKNQQQRTPTETQTQSQPVVGNVAVTWDENVQIDGNRVGKLDPDNLTPEQVRMLMGAGARAQAQGKLTGTIDPADRTFSQDPMPKVIMWDAALMGEEYTGSAEQQRLVNDLADNMDPGQVASFTRAGNTWIPHVHTTVSPIPPIAPNVAQGQPQSLNQTQTQNQPQQQATPKAPAPESPAPAPGSLADSRQRDDDRQQRRFNQPAAEQAANLNPPAPKPVNPNRPVPPTAKVTAAESKVDKVTDNALNGNPPPAKKQGPPLDAHQLAAQQKRREEAQKTQQI